MYIKKLTTCTGLCDPKPTAYKGLAKDSKTENVNLYLRIQHLSLRHEYDLLAHEEQLPHPMLATNDAKSVKSNVDDIKLILEKHPRDSDSKENQASEEQLSFDLGSPQTKKKTAQEGIVYKHLLPAKATIVFDTYWKFAAERQKIFFKKLIGDSILYTDDPIFSTFKFTNAYRASDRTSQYLIRNVIYREDLPNTPEEVFFRIILFKLFNKIETWQLLEREMGNIVYSDFSFNHCDKILTEAMERGHTIYSAAYIMPSGGKVLGHSKKHRNHLTLIEKMMADELPKKLADAQNMHQGFDLFRAYPTIGDFLAYQFITDVNYSEITNFSEMSFVVPGPGALDGIRKCFTDLGGLNEPEIIKLMAEIQESEFERLGLKFHSLFGRPLQLIDCQNLFCEVDKYSRMKHPDILGISGRTRIKQKYSATIKHIDYWYPPKWKINEKVQEAMDKIKMKKNNNSTLVVEL